MYTRITTAPLCVSMCVYIRNLKQEESVVQNGWVNAYYHITLESASIAWPKGQELI